MLPEFESSADRAEAWPFGEPMFLSPARHDDDDYGDEEDGEDGAIGGVDDPDDEFDDPEDLDLDEDEYEIEVLDADGVVWELEYSARTGELREIERD